MVPNLGAVAPLAQRLNMECAVRLGTTGIDDDRRNQESFDPVEYLHTVVSKGLRNGTRLRAEHIGQFILGCCFMRGMRKGDMTIIPRIDKYYGSKSPVGLKQRQFPF